jgi:hypothetical protein
MANITAVARSPLLAAGHWPRTTEIETLAVAGREFPRGRISEIVGAASSGRTSLLHALLAASTGLGETGALVDLKNSFDAPSAAAVGVDLARLVWVRCAGNVEHALRAADLLIHAGGFGVVALDLAGAAPRELDRIPPTAWFRFRGVLQTTPVIFAVLADRPLAKSCAPRVFKLGPRRPVFTGRAPFLLLREAI